MGAEVLDRPDVREQVANSDGDHERQAHYFRKSDIEAAYMEGATITALCGKVDTPLRDFAKFPVCKSCEEVLNAIPE